MVQIPTEADIARVSARSGRIAPNGPSGGIGQALHGFGQGLVQAAYNLNDLRAQEQADQVNGRSNEVSTSLQRFIDDEEQRYRSAVDKASASGVGFTRQYMEGYQQRANEFAKANFVGLSGNQQTEYLNSLLSTGNSLFAKSDTFEGERKKSFYDLGTNTTLDGIRTRIRSNAAPFEELKKQGLEAINSAPMDDGWKNARRAAWDTDAAESKVQWDFERDPVGTINKLKTPAGGASIASADIPPEGAALLNTIAGTESSGAYDIINGGQRFSDFSRHPKEGQRGSVGVAAGRYQDLPSTWERIQKATGVPDFSPKSQDIGNWWLAQQDYKANTGRDLLTDLRSPDANVKAGIRRALSSTWEGLKSLGDGKFVDQLGKGGDLPYDPAYDGLSYEKREQLLGQAETIYQKRQTDEAAQDKVQQAKTRDTLSLGIETGTIVTPQEILGAGIDNGDKATLLKALRSKQESDGNLAEAVAQFRSGTLSVDPYDDKGRKTVDALYGAVSQAVPEDQKQAATEEIVRQTGVVPKQVLSTLRQGANSQNPADVLSAAQAAQRLSTVDSAALSRREGGTDVQRMADTFRHYVNDLNLAPEEAAKRLADANDPAKQRDRKAIEPASKQFLKDMEKVDLASQFNDSWFAGDPSLGFTPSQELGIKADFLAIAEDQFYQANGDPDLAKARAVEEMKRLYGVTDFGGVKAVVKHPPEMYWPKSSFGTEDRATRITGSGGQGPGNVMGASKAEPSLDYAHRQLQADVAQFAKGSAAPTGTFTGLVEKGNIDLAARPVVKNADGTISTVRSMSFEEDGREVLIPTVSPDGKILGDDEAIKLYRQTGQFLGKFDNPDDADAYAKALHESQAKFYGSGDDIDPSTIQLVTTPETDAMVKRGEMPAYAILYKDKNGAYQTIPGKLWRPDISKASAVNAEKAAADKAEAERKARIVQDVERGKAERVNRPTPTVEEVMTPPTAQDILSGNDPVFGAR